PASSGQGCCCSREQPGLDDASTSCRVVYLNSDGRTSRSRMRRSAHDHRSTPHGAAKTISHGAGSLLEDAVLRSFEIDARLAGPEQRYTSNAKDTHSQLAS